MRVRSWKRWGMALGAAPLVVLALASVASGLEFIGMDVNADLDCEPGDFDMGRYFEASEVGVPQTFDVFVSDDQARTMIGFGCVFCVRDSTHLDVSSWNWTYETIGAFGTTEAFRSGQDEFSITVSTCITSLYDKWICWLIQGTDFSFVGVNTYPVKLGTMTFEPASEGPISWVFDVCDGNSALQTYPTFTSITFAGQGESCSPPAATAQKSWGGVKQLFR